MPTIGELTQIPTGGAVSLSFFTTSGAISVSRAVQVSGSPGPWTVLANSTLVEIDSVNPQWYFDVGDGLPGPLDPNTLYYYQVTDPTGSVVAGPVQPAVQIQLQADPVTDIIMGLYQAAFNNLVLPVSFKKPPRVVDAMPLAGEMPMPLCVVYRELLQQADQQIGQDLPNPDQQNIWTDGENAKYVYRISMLTMNPQERDFYANAMIAIFKIIRAYFLNQVGKDVSHTWQAASYQVTGMKEGQLPGFYGCDAMITFEGLFNTVVVTNLSMINTIGLTIEVSTDPSQTPVVDYVVIPQED